MFFVYFTPHCSFILIRVDDAHTHTHTRAHTHPHTHTLTHRPAEQTCVQLEGDLLQVELWISTEPCLEMQYQPSSRQPPDVCCQYVVNTGAQTHTTALLANVMAQMKWCVCACVCVCVCVCMCVCVYVSHPSAWGQIQQWG